MVSIIVINYKQKKYLEGCIESLYKVIRSVPFEVIVVNNSPDDDLSSLEKRYPNFTLIQNSNKGYSQANNFGVKYAQYEFLLFLNADTIFVTDPLSDVIKYMQKRNYGAVGLKLYNTDNTFQLSFGLFNNMQGESENKSREKYFRSRNLQRMLEIENKYCEITEVSWVTGAAMFMKKKVFEEVKGFDERYFLYYEDADICKRLNYKGYKNYFFPFSKIIHYKGENTNIDFNATTYYYSKASQILFYKLHNNFLNNFGLRFYLFFKFLFLYLVTFKKTNFKVLQLAVTGA